MMRCLPLLSVLRFLPALCLLVGPPAHAQIKGQAPGQPDVLVLVFSVPGGSDQIGLTYPGVVPHSTVQRDIHAIQAATGWSTANIHITDKLPPVRKSVGKMTEADFTVTGAVAPTTHYLPLEPFVQALRSYHHITLTYFVGQGFDFQGVRNYADRHVRIALEQRGATFTYQIFMLDGHVEHLKLPRYELSAVGGRMAHGDGQDGRSTAKPWLLALVALAAVGTGCVVYAVLARNA